MKTNSKQTNSAKDFSFIAVPTNLFYCLDLNLRNALTVLLQLSSVYADEEGFFFRTIEDLQKDFKMGKNLTIAVLETLYLNDLLQVKSVGFRKGVRRVNFYRVNIESFKEFEQFNLYTITNCEDLQINTVDYKAKGFKVTYTSSTDTANITQTKKAEKSTVEPQTTLNQATPSDAHESGSKGQEMPSNGIKETSIQVEPIDMEKAKENSPSNVDKTSSKAEAKHIENSINQTPTHSEDAEELDKLLDELFGKPTEEIQNVVVLTEDDINKPNPKETKKVANSFGITLSGLMEYTKLTLPEKIENKSIDELRQLEVDEINRINKNYSDVDDGSVKQLISNMIHKQIELLEPTEDNDFEGMEIVEDEKEVSRCQELVRKFQDGCNTWNNAKIDENKVKAINYLDFQHSKGRISRNTKDELTIIINAHYHRAQKVAQCCREEA